MTPSGVGSKTGVGADVQIGQDCQGNCHSSPKIKNTDPFVPLEDPGKAVPWFVDGQTATSPYAKSFSSNLKNTDLADWAQKLTLSEPPVTPTPRAANPQEIIDKAKSEEALGDKGTTTDIKLAHFETALFNFQLSKDLDGTKRVYEKIRKTFVDQGNSIGLTKIDAEIAFIEGRFNEALSGLQSLETLYQNHSPQLPEAQRQGYLTELNLKITLVHRAQAAALSKDEKWTEALNHMEAALKRNPSPLLAGETLALFNKVHDPKILRRRMARVQEEVFQLQREEYAPCNSNCHKANQGPHDFQGTDFRKFYLEDGKDEDPFSLIKGWPKQGAGEFSDANRKSIEIYLQGLSGTPSNDGTGSPTAPAVATQPRESSIDSQWYQTLPAAPKVPNSLSDKKTALAADRNQAEADYEQWAQKVAWIVRTGYGNATSGESFVQQELALAQVYQSQGDLTRTQSHLKDLLEMIPHDPTDASSLLQRTTISHQLAMVQLTLGNDTSRGVKNPGLLTEAIGHLDRTYSELKVLRQNSGVRFLLNQNRFLRAEILITQSRTVEDIQDIQRDLKDILNETPIRYLPAEDPNRALLGRVKLRLAQVSFGLPDERETGHRLVGELMQEFPNDSYLGSQAMVAQGMAYLSTEGKSLRGLKVLREMQKSYPGSDGDLMVRSAKNLKNLLGPDGILKENIDEEDFGEAFKVALDKAVNTGPRKLGFIGTGFAIVAILVPEPSTTALGLGMLGGLAVDMGLGVAEGWGDIMDSYRTGISPIDTTRNLQNFFLLALDVALLVTAGAGGAMVRKGTEYGLSRVAVGTSEFLSRSALGTFTAKALLPMGQFAYRWLPRVAESTAAYTFYQAERSLVFGTEFTWDAGEAALMFGMMQSFALAHSMGYGARLATGAKFQKGNLKPVFHEGKLVGFSNPAGRLAGWATDTVLGATGFYGLLVGLNQSGITREPLPNYWDFLGHQIVTLGSLHLGGKWVPQSFNRHLAKLDSQAKANLKRAKDIIDQSPYDGFGPGFGPQLAFATATVTPARGPGFGFKVDPIFRPQPMAMATYRPNDSAPDSGNHNKGSSRLTEVEMVQQLKETLKRHPRITTQFRGNWKWLEGLDAHQLRALYDLSQVPSEGMGTVLSEILYSKNSQQALDLLRSMDAEAAQGLRGLVRLDKSSDATSMVRRFFRTEWMFESPEGSPQSTATTRGMLLLQAFAHLEKIPGAKEAMEKTTMEYQENAGHWQVYAPGEKALWRGNVEELIRLGALQARAEAGEGQALTSVNQEMGHQRFVDEGGRSRRHRMEADGLRKDQWMDELKSTYNAAVGGPGALSFTSMGGESAVKFKNQVRKYGQAVNDKKIAGVTYQITAKSIDADVVRFIKEHIPNVKIIRYDSILETTGTVVDQQMTLIRLKPDVSPKEFMASHSNDVVFIRDGKIQAFTFRGPPRTDHHPKETVTELLTETYEATGLKISETPSSLPAARFKFQIEKAAELMKRLEPKAGEKFEEKILDLLTEATWQKSPHDAFRYARKGLDKLLQEYLVEQGYGNAVDSIAIPVKLDHQRNLSPQGEAQGQYHLYFKTQDFAKFRKTVPSSNPEGRSVFLKKGTLLFTDRGYTSSEVKQLSGKTMRGDQLFAFDTRAKLPIEEITLPNGEKAYRVTKDHSIETKDLEITYYGENPHLDIFSEAM